MINIIIADDHKVLTEGITQLLEKEEDMACVAQVHNGHALLQRLKEVIPDILLLDINLPDISGVELCKKITSQYPDVRVVVLTMYKKASFIKQLMRNGASGYLLKNADKEEILEAIRKVSNGETYLSREANRVWMESLSRNRSGQQFIPELTRREQEILQLIAREYTTSEISEELHISLHTVETHRRNLLQKMNVRNVAGLIRTAMKKGLLE